MAIDCHSSIILYSFACCEGFVTKIGLSLSLLFPLDLISFSDSLTLVKKVTGELSWKIKVSLPEGKYQNFC